MIHAGRTLIFDVGFNNGRDTVEYLRSGARVVAIEANPALVRKANVAFEPFLRAGQLVLLNVLLVDNASAAAGSTLPFFVHTKRDEWSSTDPKYGCRSSSNPLTAPSDRSLCEEHQVALQGCGDLMRRFGTPTFLKLDIEGGEDACLNALPRLAASSGAGALPTYLSFEYSVKRITIERLTRLKMGYTRVKMVEMAPFPDWSGPWGELAADSSANHRPISGEAGAGVASSVGHRHPKLQQPQHEASQPPSQSQHVPPPPRSYRWNEVDRWLWQNKALGERAMCRSWCDIHLALGDAASFRGAVGYTRLSITHSKAHSSEKVPLFVGWDASSIEERGARLPALRNQTTGAAIPGSMRWSGRIYKRLNESEIAREVQRIAAIRLGEREQALIP